MRILAHVHRWTGPGGHFAGAENMMHEMLVWLAAQGHDSRAIVGRRLAPFTLDGIDVRYGGVGRDLDRAYAQADIIVTHLDLTKGVVEQAKRSRRPVVHVVHNHRQLAYYRIRPHQAALVVMNSEWLAEAVCWTGRQVIVRPPVSRGRYQVDRSGDAVVLLNLAASKGGDLFWRLAELMPERRFIGVRGAYGVQEVPRRLPPNGEVWDKQEDARAAYRQARVVLMPSTYESWGRVAIEAAASGIPTIAAPTPGLRESLGADGIFCDVDNIDAWVDAIRWLDVRAVYERTSALASARFDQLERQATVDLALLEEHLLDIAAPAHVGAESVPSVLAKEAPNG